MLGYQVRTNGPGGMSLYHTCKSQQINRFSWSCDLRLISHAVGLAKRGRGVWAGGGGKWGVRKVGETKVILLVKLIGFHICYSSTRFQ